MLSQMQIEMRDQENFKQVNPAFLPALCRRTNTAAIAYQMWYYRAIAIEAALSVIGGLAVVAALIPSVSPVLENAIGVQLFGGKVLPLSIATAVALLLTMITILVRYRWQPGEHWRQSRFVGENDASLAWRYGARSTDYDLGTGPPPTRALRTGTTPRSSICSSKRVSLIFLTKAATTRLLS